MSKNVEKVESQQVQLVVIDGSILEYPLFFLGRGNRPTEIRHEFLYENRNGQVLAKRTIEFKNTTGVPGLLEMDTLFALMALWADQGYEKNFVIFTIYDICKKLQLPYSHGNRENIQKALSCLANTSYITKNAIYSGGQYTRRKDFSLISLDRYEYKETDVGKFDKEAIRDANKAIFNDFIIDNLREHSWKLDFNKYVALPKGMPRRFFTYLQKRSGPWFKVGIRKLADKVPIQGPLSEVRRKIKENMPPLVEKEVVLRWSFSKDKKQILFKLPTNQLYLPGMEDINTELLAALTAPKRGITDKKARELLLNYSEVRIAKQIKHFDWRQAQKPDETGAGFLIRAIEEDWVLPGKLQDSLKIEEKQREEEEEKRQTEEERIRLEKVEWDSLEPTKKRDLFLNEFDNVAHRWERFGFVEEERENLSKTLLGEAKKGKTKEDLVFMYESKVKEMGSKVKAIQTEEEKVEKDRKKLFDLYMEKHKLKLHMEYNKKILPEERASLKEEAKNLYLEEQGLPKDTVVALKDYDVIIDMLVDQKAGVMPFDQWIMTEGKSYTKMQNVKN